MDLLYPIGLISLLSLLLLILIYILKPKFQERKVASTFIWKLSLKYKRKRPPFQWIQNSLLFILQVLVLTFLAVLLARPVYSIKENNEKIIILDASASMQTIKNNETRFERAIKQIKTLANNKGEDKKFTLVIANNEPSYVVRREASIAIIEEEIDKLACTFIEADLNAAVTLARSVLTENKEAEVILYSDHEFESLGDITLKNMRLVSEWNAGILNFNTAFINGEHQFNAKVASYGRDASLVLNLIVNDIKISSKVVTCSEDVPIMVTFEDTFLTYKTAKLELEAQDDFIYDNEYYLYGGNREQLKVQLVSPSPIFLFGALRPLNCTVDVLYSYNNEDADKVMYSGYDLYVFDGFEITQWPTDGAVWIVNPIGDIIEEAGFKRQLNDTGDIPSVNAEAAGNYESKIYNRLIQNFQASNLSLTKYTLLSSYEGYETILKVGNNPILITKNIGGVKTTVFLFDIAYSTLPILFPDYLYLIKNLKEYSIGYTSQKLVYTTGENVDIFLKANTLNYSIHYSENLLEYEKEEVNLFLDKPGTCTIVQKLASGLEVTDNFFIKVAESDSDFSLVGKSLEGIVRVKKKVTFSTQELVVYISAAVLIFVVVEWGMQYRELF